jgi:hypothetical protein
MFFLRKINNERCIERYDISSRYAGPLQRRGGRNGRKCSNCSIRCSTRRYVVSKRMCVSRYTNDDANARRPAERQARAAAAVAAASRATSISLLSASKYITATGADSPPRTASVNHNNNNNNNNAVVEKHRRLTNSAKPDAVDDLKSSAKLTKKMSIESSSSESPKKSVTRDPRKTYLTFFRLLPFALYPTQRGQRCDGFGKRHVCCCRRHREWRDDDAADHDGCDCQAPAAAASAGPVAARTNVIVVDDDIAHAGDARAARQREQRRTDRAHDLVAQRRRPAAATPHERKRSLEYVNIKLLLFCFLSLAVRKNESLTPSSAHRFVQYRTLSCSTRSYCERTTAMVATVAMAAAMARRRRRATFGSRCRAYWRSAHCRRTRRRRRRICSAPRWRRCHRYCATARRPTRSTSRRASRSACDDASDGANRLRRAPPRRPPLVPPSTPAPLARPPTTTTMTTMTPMTMCRSLSRACTPHNNRRQKTLTNASQATNNNNGKTKTSKNSRNNNNNDDSNDM